MSKTIKMPENGKSGENTISKLVDTAAAQSSLYKGAHRAGFDAFMTGYCLASFAVRHFDLTPAVQQTSVKFEIGQLKNNVALSGKDFALKVQSSEFCRTSTYHDAKFQAICASRMF